MLPNQYSIDIKELFKAHKKKPDINNKDNRLY